MALFDLPLDELRGYRPEIAEPQGFDKFWESTLAEARTIALEPVFQPVDSGLVVVDTFDVTFTGFGGTRVKAWLHVPAGATAPLPTVVEYVGYNGGRGLAHQNVLYASAGYAHFIMDTRGQGAGSTVGQTPDDHADAGLNAVSGRMTQGILDPATYYYRRLYTDAVRAVDAAAAHPLVDASRMVVAGASQGGGLCIAVAALSKRVVGAMPDVPFLSHFSRAITITDNLPYGEIPAYLMRHRDQVQQVYRTLSFFDGVVLAKRAHVPALFSVALMDRTCPPSTVFAAYNHWACEDRDIEVYPFNGHEGGQEFHQLRKLGWLRAHTPVTSVTGFHIGPVRH
ncbi:acetylxylan esterase [Paenarthrobacter sp. Z7-10]|uniref:acetylxylan esterase n=1 Tax=Paenarthrobacter sp. Z7-10 TaxID=2787635 RepID=UPI0022A9131B|nr:acetylxylan esterase [Paenarthrobacter sp. Z7-10]MCZ2401778.1 acetylxylan esterase [Paenarthrobacter sp. Z7-10]